MPRTVFACLFVGLGCAAPADLPPDGGSPTGLDGGPARRDAGDESGRDASPPPDDAGADAAPPTADAGCDQPELHGAAPPLVDVGACGRLSYGAYASRGASDAVHRVPDFSHAGYRGGGVALPTAAVVVTLEPGDGDDRARIQAAIDEVSARPRGPDGLRGAVLLRRGTYEVSDTLVVAASGVVLRGEGQGRDGTVLVATRRAQHDLVRVQGGGGGLGEVSGTRVRITSPRVPVGSRTFEVERADSFRVGQTVGVLRTPNATWIDDLGMAPYGWTPGSYTIGHERRIAAIDGRSVTVDIPIVDALEERYGGGALFAADLSGRVDQVGVEDLRIDSEFTGSTDEDHGWVAVRLRRATDSWVRRVTAVHFGYSAVSIDDESSFDTVEDCAMLAPVSQVTGGRRYSFNVSGGVGNLFQRCYSEQARHDFVTGARVTGPHVWLDCFSTESTNDDGPHHRWATGLLFDNTSGHELHVENRTSSGTGHGWSGAQVMFWNGRADGIRCDAPTGAMSWAVGCVGSMDEGGWAPAEPFGIWESHGSPIAPRSLYLAQLRDRLGPAAVEAVTLPAQRAGRLWYALERWAGEGRLEDVVAASADPACATGVAAGDVCCAASCGTCGGTGCGGRPGGADLCCSGPIRSALESCAGRPPPCLL